MIADTGAAAAMAASANEFPRASRIAPASLRSREKDGSYPFRDHRTVAELWSECGAMAMGDAVVQFENVTLTREPVAVLETGKLYLVRPQIGVIHGGH